MKLSPGNEESFRATSGDGAADDDDKLSFDLAFSLLLFFKKKIQQVHQQNVLKLTQFVSLQ